MTVSPLLPPSSNSNSCISEQFDETSETAECHDSTSGFYAVYECKEILGTGMSSVVRRCLEKSTQNEYAVKIIDVSTEKASEEQAAELRISTVREISILRMLAGHRNIIRMHDFLETQTFLFIVFELCSGGELFDYLTRVVTLSEKKTRLIMRQLFLAISEMHNRNIVHRDLKPENILMESEDKIKLTDFGFAYQLGPNESLTVCDGLTFIMDFVSLDALHAIELCGTPGYLAPEVLAVSMSENAEGYGLKVDLWACGVIMYTLLCGYAPFYHRKQIYMLRAISEGRYEFRSPEWDEISSAAKDLIRHLLVVSPKERFSAKQALAHPFFQVISAPEEFLGKPFDPRKKFKLAIVQVRSLCRLLKIKFLPIPLSATAARTNPYAARKIRKQIDGCAFHVYGHWIKKGREQYRDTLFANALTVTKRTVLA